MWKAQSYTIRGMSALIVHNGQLANPLNSFTKALKTVSSKRNKTDADFEEMAKLEWYGSLYLFNGEPALPGNAIEATLIAAARKQRKGQQAKAGVFVDGLYPIIYDGPRDPHALWALEEYRLSVGVRVQRSTVIRTRPIFRQWACTFVVSFDDTLLNPADVTNFLRYAGANVGIGDWRPKFGRFLLEE
jgi:hypothetical protein